MRRYANPSRYHAVASDAAIDWDHPDNRGLALALLGLPGVATGGGRWPEVSGKSAHLTTTADARWGPTPRSAGGGLVCNAAGKGATALAAGSLRRSLPVSWAISLYQLGTPEKNATLFGVCPNTSNASPFLSYSLYYNTTPNLSFGGNSGGGFVLADTGISAVSLVGQWVRLVAALTAAGLTVYRNGVAIYTDATGRSDPTYASDAAVFVGNYPGVSRNTNAILADGRIWGRALAAAEVARDYEWSLDSFRDPRLRWVSTRTWFVPQSPPAAGGVFLPAFVGL